MLITSQGSADRTPGAKALLSDYLGEHGQLVLTTAPALLAALRSFPGRAPDGSAGTTPDADALVDLIHNTRVALRRLRSAARTFADAFVDSESAALVGAAAWYADGLGRLRDLDVLEARVEGTRARIDSTLVVGEVWSWLDEAISEERGYCRIEVIESLSGERAAGFRALLAQWVAAPPFSEDVDQVNLRRLVRRADRQFRRRLEQAIGLALEDADSVPSELTATFHRARKAAKRARYALDVTAPALEDGPTPRLAELKTMQGQLGTIQDAAVSMQAMVAFGERIGRRSGRNAFTLGALAALEQSSQRVAIQALVREHSSG